MFNAGALGLGVRGTVDVAPGEPRSNLALEVGRGFTDLRGVKAGWRANMLASVTF